VPSFTLAADERPVPLPEVLEQFDSLAAANDRVEFYWFPYGSRALVKRNNRVSASGAGPAAPGAAPMPGWRRFWEFEVPVEVRVTAADDIWLSTAYGRDTGYIAVHQYAGLPYQEYFDAFESIAASAGGRPHWGKLHCLDAERLRALYPRFEDFRRVRAETDPDCRFGNSYLARVLGGAASRAGSLTG